MDKYDEAVAYLTAHPEDIVYAWQHPKEHPAGCLFQYAAPNVGCISQVRRDPFFFGKELAPHLSHIIDAIAEDERIPMYEDDIDVGDLDVFRERQRWLDKELDRGE